MRGRYRMRNAVPRRVRGRRLLVSVFRDLDRGVKEGVITQAEADARKAQLTELQTMELSRRSMGE